MQIEQVKPNKPSFPWVVFWFCTSILAIFVFAVLLVHAHYKKPQHPPYSQHPVSKLVQPVLASPAQSAQLA